MPIEAMQLPNLTGKSILKNLLAGLTVAIVALPLALAFGIASGLGAAAGVATAVIAGMVAAAFGGSKYQVSGPTGAMTVVLLPIVHQFGPAAILQVGLIAGALLVIAAGLKLGKHIHKLPDSLVEGFTAGIALIIALQQTAFVLGVQIQHSDKVWASALAEVQNWFANPSPHAIGIAALALIANLFGPNRWPKLPLALLTVIVLTIAVDLVNADIPRIGELPLTFLNPGVEFVFASDWLPLILPAIAVAFLAGLESLLSARIADGLTSHANNHQPNRELFGQGLANLAVPFFGGIPATAALARTAVNVRSGADSRIAAFSHAVFLAIFVLALAPLVERIPLAALGGVLIATAWHMVRFSELKKTAAKSKLDALVLILTFAATLVFDLITALGIGMVVYLVFRKSKLAISQLRIDAEETFGD